MGSGPSMDSRAITAGSPDAEAELALMERNGITRITAYQYRVDGYRYTNLSDALAQVERGSRERAKASSRPVA